MKKQPLPVVEDDSPYRNVPIKAIRAWAGNPRKHFDERSLAELAESIKAQGVLQPILLRPIPAFVGKVKRSSAGGNGSAKTARYEIAAGERRWRAAELAGLAAIPAIIRELTDKEMLEIAVSENEQRQDISPLEKADGYAALIETHGATLEEIAGRVGKSVSTIRSVLRLRALPDTARSALADGKISASIAELIASRPNDDMRIKAAAYALSPNSSWDGVKRVQDLPTYRNVRGWIEGELMVELKGAPFNPNESGLTSAGACTACPKKTGNDREQYPDGRADLCTDPVCYREKVEAWTERAKVMAKEEGQKFLTPSETEAAFPYDSSISYSAPYYDLADQPFFAGNGKKRPSYKQLLEPYLNRQDIVLCIDKRSTPHRLVCKTIADPILKEKHGLKPASDYHSRLRTTPEAKKKERAKASKEGWLRRRTEELMLVGAYICGRRSGRSCTKATFEVRDFLRAVAVSMTTNCWPESVKSICRRRGLEGKNSIELLEALKADAATADLEELFGLLAELICARHLLAVHGAGNRPLTQEVLQLDYKACQKQAVQEYRDKTRRNGKASGPDEDADDDQGDDGAGDPDEQGQLELPDDSAEE